MTRTKRATAGAITLAALMAFALIAAFHAATATAAEPDPMATVPSTGVPFDELLDVSLSEKRGLTFFIGGQTLPGVVTKRISLDAVEVRNQSHDRIVVRLDRVDAVALN